jgi:tRNA(fMet)-specific endonuclease VapC
MNGKFLLDTNIVIGMLEKDTTIVRRLDPSMELYLSSIVMGELFYGARNSGRADQNLRRLEKLMLSIPVLPCDRHTAQSYGILRTELRKKGKPLPDNDIWIAAVAHQKQLTVITRDAHFRQLESVFHAVW